MRLVGIGGRESDDVFRLMRLMSSEFLVARLTRFVSICFCRSLIPSVVSDVEEAEVECFRAFSSGRGSFMERWAVKIISLLN